MRRQAPPTHGWTPEQAAALHPYVAPPWLIALRAREAARQERIRSWRAARETEGTRGPRKKFEPPGLAHDGLPGLRARMFDIDARRIEEIRERKNRRAGLNPDGSPPRIAPHDTGMHQAALGQGNEDSRLAVGGLGHGFRPKP